MFRIGPVRRDEKRNQRFMGPGALAVPQWNRLGLQRRQKHIDALDPEAKGTTITYQVYFAGLQHEAKSIRKGDYVLQAKAAHSSWNVPMIATVYVNGQPLTRSCCKNVRW